MITAKQRAFLKSIAQKTEVTLIVGKYGVNDETIRQLDLLIEKRELVKIKLLNNITEDKDDLVKKILEKTRAEFVSHLGNKLVIYRQKREKEGRLELPQ